MRAIIAQLDTNEQTMADRQCCQEIHQKVFSVKKLGYVRVIGAIVHDPNHASVSPAAPAFIDCSPQVWQRARHRSHCFPRCKQSAILREPKPAAIKTLASENIDFIYKVNVLSFFYNFSVSQRINPSKIAEKGMAFNSLIFCNLIDPEQSSKPAAALLLRLPFHLGAPSLVCQTTVPAALTRVLVPTFRCFFFFCSVNTESGRKSAILALNLQQSNVKHSSWLIQTRL